LYELSVRVGEAIARAGFEVVTGGYMGTMAGTSEGAARVPGASVRGILASAVFPHRNGGGNEHLTTSQDSSSLIERLTIFTTSCHAYVVLPGNTGTLTEFMLVWNISIVNKFSNTPHVALIAFRDPWEGVIRSLGEQLGIPAEDIALIRFVDTPEQVVEELRRAGV
jgi:uncharacterized protein (TIGR00725 family)